MPRVMVNLVDVICFDPEDVTGGGDQFYVIGAVSDGEQTRGITTEPIQVGANQTRAFGVGGGVVFDQNVPPDRVLKVALTAFDEDAGKDWAKQQQLINEITVAVAGGLAAVPNPYTAGAAIVLPFVVSAAGSIIALDKDDNLGSHTQDFPVWSLGQTTHPVQWQFNGDWAGGFLGFSKWSYALRYNITVM